MNKFSFVLYTNMAAMQTTYSSFLWIDFPVFSFIKVSVMFFTIITTDRLICIVFNLTVQHLTLKACYIISFAAWSLGIVLSFLPLSGLSYFYDTERDIRFYGRSAVCLAHQLSNDRPPGWSIPFPYSLVWIFLHFSSYRQLTQPYFGPPWNHQSR